MTREEALDVLRDLSDARRLGGVADLARAVLALHARPEAPATKPAPPAAEVKRWWTYGGALCRKDGCIRYYGEGPGYECQVVLASDHDRREEEHKREVARLRETVAITEEDNRSNRETACRLIAKLQRGETIHVEELAIISMRAPTEVGRSYFDVARDTEKKLCKRAEAAEARAEGLQRKVDKLDAAIAWAVGARADETEGWFHTAGEGRYSWRAPLGRIRDRALADGEAL